VDGLADDCRIKEADSGDVIGTAGNGPRRKEEQQGERESGSAMKRGAERDGVCGRGDSDGHEDSQMAGMGASANPKVFGDC
jgi:hypothetical protein